MQTHLFAISTKAKDGKWSRLGNRWFMSETFVVAR